MFGGSQFQSMTYDWGYYGLQMGEEIKNPRAQRQLDELFVQMLTTGTEKRAIPVREAERQEEKSRSLIEENDQEGGRSDGSF